MNSSVAYSSCCQPAFQSWSHPEDTPSTTWMLQKQLQKASRTTREPSLSYHQVTQDTSNFSHTHRVRSRTHIPMCLLPQSKKALWIYPQYHGFDRSSSQHQRRTCTCGCSCPRSKSACGFKCVLLGLREELRCHQRLLRLSWTEEDWADKHSPSWLRC